MKALSDQRFADLKAGRGMGLALAAELNGYPGPSHVLELADSLQLPDERRTRTKALLDAMQGALRSAHLRYHLAMFQVLSPGQMARYTELRGYARSRDHGRATP